MFNVKTSETFQLKSGVRKGYSINDISQQFKVLGGMGNGHEWAISCAIWDECRVLE